MLWVWPVTGFHAATVNLQCTMGFKALRTGTETHIHCPADPAFFRALEGCILLVGYKARSSWIHRHLGKGRKKELAT